MNNGQSPEISKISQARAKQNNILWIGPYLDELRPFLSEIYSEITAIESEQIESLALAANRTHKQVLVICTAQGFSALNEQQIEILNQYNESQKILVCYHYVNKILDKQTLRLVNGLQFDHILFLPADESKLQLCLMAALKSDDSASADSLGIAPSDSGQEIAHKIARMRGMVQFVNDVSQVATVEQLLERMRPELKNFHSLKEPILAYANNQNQLLLLYYQGSQLSEKILSDLWAQQLQIRINDKNDSQYLANILGRPFAKLVTLPLTLKRKLKNENIKVSAVLFFEHSMSDSELKEFSNYIQDRVPAIGITLDRILLEYDMNETSLLWEKTFDGLQDPLAIFDYAGELIRANKSFMNKLAAVPKAQLASSNLLWANRIYEAHSYPISFAAGTVITHTITYYVDVTTKVKLQKQMIQNEKMAALGHMAGHIAHELNNPLTGIRSLAQILTSQAAAGSHIQKDFLEIEKAAERCQLVIRNLLDFSRPEADNHVVLVSMNEIIGKTLPLLKSLISKYEMNIELTTDNSDILVEPHLMQQVVFNIINNAAQAMGDYGKLDIKTSITEDEVRLSVKDTGGGIPEEIKGQIFDFFFTTKSQGQGTGLGLSICKSIIDRFNGKIEVFSEINKGSEFVISLPKAQLKKLLQKEL